MYMIPKYSKPVRQLPDYSKRKKGRKGSTRTGLPPIMKTSRRQHEQKWGNAVKKAVIFDFDGTIIDTESAWFDIYQQILKERHGFDLTLDEFVKVVGSTDGKLFDRIEETLGFTLDRAEFHELVNARFEIIREQLTLRDGFLETAKQLEARGIAMAVASSSTREWIEGFLTKYGLISYFPIIVSADDVETVKPDPAIYLTALDRLGVTADEAIAVEDSYNGSIAAISAGIHCLIIPNDVTRSLSFHEKGQLMESFADFDYALLGQPDDGGACV